MDETVGVEELRARLAAYLRRANQGERITVTRSDWPVARLGPLEEADDDD
jgi:prevent-host-death family protein